MTSPEVAAIPRTSRHSKAGRVQMPVIEFPTRDNDYQLPAHLARTAAEMAHDDRVVSDSLTWTRRGQSPLRHHLFEREVDRRWSQVARGAVERARTQTHVCVHAHKHARTHAHSRRQPQCRLGQMY